MTVTLRAVIRQVETTGFPALVWKFPKPLRAISTSPLGGGVGHRRWAINAQVPPDYDRTDPADHLRDIAADLGLHDDGLHDDGVGFLTAVDVRTCVRAEHDGVEAWATVGLSAPLWAADPLASDPVPVVGTINVVAWVPASLSPAAMVNAVATATEAKVQALRDAGVAGTGTATDAVCVLCHPEGALDPYGGPRSAMGSRLARAVHGAVLRGVTP